MLRRRPRRLTAGRFALACASLLISSLAASTASAAPAPQRTRFELPASNGHGAVLLDLKKARLVQFREHLFAAEEPVLDANNSEVWDGDQFATVHTRDLLFDTYFGVRAEGQQQWLSEAPVDLDASGYLPWTKGATGGTGIVTMVQKVGALRLTTHAFAPQGLPAGSFVLVLALENTGAVAIKDVAAFSLHNFHLGYGRPTRPWELANDLGANGETIEYDGAGNQARYRERGFAGTVVTRALGTISHRGVGPGADLHGIVKGGVAKDFPDNAPPMGAVDDSVSGFQWTIGELAPATTQWVGFIVMHDGDPLAGVKTQATLDAFVAGRDAQTMLLAEVAGWKTLQQAIKLPAGLDAGEETLVRHGAAMLHMGQVQEDRYFLREFLSKDGETRRTRFKGVDDQPVNLPAMIKHRGKGAILASLPPGEWTYAWIRDGAYATAAFAALGMTEHARDALNFYLDAEGGRFQSWDELKPYAMPPYQISLVRYHGFGVEETDFNAFGPNLEFDGFGLFLWALRAHEQLTGDTSVADARWPLIRDKIADAIVALVDPDTGLMRADSSIWETHWKGRERHFAYTSITAARGLCDAAAIAERLGDDEHAAKYKAAGEALRAAIAGKLRDAGGALAANSEELAAGEGYWDAAVLDAFAMGLFDPKGPLATATIKGLDEHLRVDAGPGWSRNDDRWDHQNAEDLSPWGGEYDSAEWVVTDLRGAITLRKAGDEARAEGLGDWVLAQAQANYLMVAETYDELAGTYKFNTPMLGFGAGAYALAMAHRAGAFADPACGAYFDEGDVGGTDSDSGDPTTGTSTGDATSSPTDPSTDPTATPTTTANPGTTGSGGVDSSGTLGGPGVETTVGERGEAEGCACRSEGRGGPPLVFGLLVLGLLGRRRR
jgi:MYXO-CTERM domain-containing protein